MIRSVFLMTALLVPASVLAASEMDHAGHHHGHHKHHNHMPAPVGVMGSHLHKAGGLMFSYRLMYMDMEGNRDGTSRISTASVLGSGYMMAPTKMSMKMHMLGAMYGINNRATLMAMLPYLEKKMSMVNMMSANITSHSEGVGDVKVSLLYGLLDKAGRKLHLNLGVSLPSGSIDERGNSMSSTAKLPYPMQLGSGTTDLLLGMTYTSHGQAWSWGAQGMATIRTGENDNHYTLGNRYELTAWLARKLQHSATGFVRLKYSRWGDIDGADPELNVNMTPGANPNIRAGKRADLMLGLHIKPMSGALKGHSFSAEVGAPVYQDLDGPQMETDLVATIGWQYMFR